MTKTKEAFPNKKIQFLNAGHGGWGQQQMIAYLEKYGFHLKPDLIIMVMGPQDLEDNQAYQLYKEKDGQLIFDDTTLKKKQSYSVIEWLKFHSLVLQLFRIPAITAMQKWFVFKEETKFAWSRINKIKALQPEFPPFDPEQGFLVTKKLFVYLKNICKKNRTPLIVTNVGHGSYHTAGFFVSAVSFFKEVGIDYINMFPEMYPLVEKEGYPLFIPNDNHFNSPGNRIYSDRLWAHLYPRLKSHIHSNKVFASTQY